MEANPNNGEKIRRVQTKYYAATHGRFRTPNKRRTYPDTAKPLLPGARCGEIFVAKNARKWTFVCTYCNKSTRDIGDFICHIKVKHLEASAYLDEGSGDSYYDGSEDEYYQQEESSGYASSDRRNLKRRNNKPNDIDPISQRSRREPQPAAQVSLTAASYEDQPDSITANSTEYVDYGNYLHVNVHSDTEILGHDEEAQYDEVQSTGVPQLATIKSEPLDVDDVIASQPILNSDVTLMDGERDDNGAAKSTQPMEIRYNNESINSVDLSASSGRKRRYHEAEPDQSSQHGGKDLERCYNGNSMFNGEENDFDNQELLVPFQTVESGNDTEGNQQSIAGPVCCSICNKTFLYHSLLRNHMVKHSSETPFSCDLCEKRFKSKQALRYHISTHSRDKAHKCPLCREAFYSEAQYITHVFEHEDENTFPCPTCGKILPSQKARDMHVFTHTKDRPHPCDFCHKRFRLRHHLLNHLKMHRQYRCMYCKMDFISEVYLRKPYACDKCEAQPGVNKVIDTNRLSIKDHIDMSLYSFESVQVEDAAPGRRTITGTNSCEIVSDSNDAEGEADEVQQDGEHEAEEEVQLVQLDQRSDDDDVFEVQETTPPQQLPQHVGRGYKKSGKKRLTCKFCSRSYSHISGLNYHIRNKHN